MQPYGVGVSAAPPYGVGVSAAPPYGVGVSAAPTYGVGVSAAPPYGVGASGASSAFERLRVPELVSRLDAAQEQCDQLRGNQDWTPRQEAELEAAAHEFLLSRRSELVLYGARALNRRLPPWLQVSTVDYDLFLRGGAGAGTDALARISQHACAWLQQRFPQRCVWERPALHNPDASRSVLVSQRHILDFTLAPPQLIAALPLIALEDDGGLAAVPQAWLFDNLQALLVNANARHLWRKAATRLLRLCWADYLGLLAEPLGDCAQALASLGPHGAPLLVQRARRAQEQQALAQHAADQQRLAEQQAALQHAEQINERQARQLREQAQQRQRAEALLGELQEQARAKQELLDASQRSLALVERQAAAAQQRHDDALAGARRRAAQLQRELDARARQLQRTEATSLELSAALKVAEKDAAKQRGDLAELRAEFAELRDANAELAADAQVGAAEQLRGQLHSANAHCREFLAELVQLRPLREELARLKGELARAEHLHAELHSRYFELRRAFEDCLHRHALPTRLLDAGRAALAQPEVLPRSWQLRDVEFKGRRVDLTVWLCTTCARGPPRTPSQKSPVLQLDLADEPLGLPLLRDKDSAFYICNTCFYDNLLRH